MRLPKLYHVVGSKVWRRCEHWQTELHEPSASVRLCSLEVDETDGEAEQRKVLSREMFDAWIEARGGAVVYRCTPDRCEETLVLLADPNGYLKVLEDAGWVSLQTVAEKPRMADGATALRFCSEKRPSSGAPFDHPGALAADPFGRLWLLERGAARIRLLAETDLHLLDTVAAPPGAELVDVATTGWGVVAADRAGGCLWRQPYGARWEKVELEFFGELAGFQPVAVAGGRFDHALAILRPPIERPSEPSRLVVVGRDMAHSHTIAGLTQPLPLLMLRSHEVLIGDLEGPPLRAGLLRFTRFRLTEKGLADPEPWGVRSFDGRALFLDVEGRPHATTATGVRPLFRRQSDLVEEGVVETFALDSERYGCSWHRVFLDICLPAGTSVEVHARTSDDLPPESLRRLPKPEHPPEHSATATAWDALPLGSRTPYGQGRPDNEGWIPLGTLDRRAAQADIPFPPGCATLPSQDAYQEHRVSGPEPVAFDTLEGLLKNPPGRYLWLRIHLRGGGRRSPALVAVRATYPRPSLLEHLPAFWRAEPGAAEAMDHALSLFEGLYTEIDQRLEVLCRIFDPRVCPPEALEWLASFVGLVFDSRVKESVRRQLLTEAVSLYQTRGTVPGLERLCAILGECRVKLIEGFRVRRRSVAFLGKRLGLGGLGILGPGLQLGATESASDAASRSAWEHELVTAHAELTKRRQLQQASGDVPCPEVDPPPPLSDDPVVTFYRQHAHRFSVLLFRHRDPEVEAVIQSAIEGAKPAHTLHELCWLDAGLRLGTNAYVGIGTRLAGSARFSPALLGQAPLGTDRTLSRPSDHAPRTFVGASELGRTSHLG